jgi:hypothetical protein
MVASLDHQILSVKPRAADAQAELACLKADRDALGTAWRTVQTSGYPSAGPWPELRIEGVHPSGLARLGTRAAAGA